MYNYYDILNIPNSKGHLNIELIVKDLNSILNDMNNKSELSVKQKNDKEFVEEILKFYNNDVKNNKKNEESFINMYIRLKYQLSTRYCNSEQDKDEYRQAYFELENEKKRSEHEKSIVDNNFRSSLAKKLDINEQIKKFMEENPYVKNYIYPTNYYKNYNARYYIEDYGKNIKFLDYTDDNDTRTKAYALGKVVINLINTVDKNKHITKINYSKDIEMDIVKVVKTQHDGSTNNYTVLTIVPNDIVYDENGKQTLSIPSMITDKDEQQMYAEKIFSYAMLEISKKNRRYLGQTNIVRNVIKSIYSDDPSINFDGIIMELLGKIDVKKDRNGMTLYEKIENIASRNDINNEKSNYKNQR